jgi:serine protease AprX
MATSPRFGSPALRRTLTALLSAGVLLGAADAHAQGRRARVSSDLAERIDAGDAGATTVIVTGTDAQLGQLVARHRLGVVKRLATGAVLEVPAGALAAVAADPNVDQLSSNYAIRSQMAVTNQTIGADLTQEGGWAQGIGALTGEGIGVAVIDSGVSPVPELKDRIVVNVDFISRRGAALDQYGHGTHVAGIIAASGKNRVSDTTGVAPGAHIINLKVLDENGAGTVADAVEAVDWAIAHKDQYNIRVINMSLGGPVLQGWRDDPLAQAVERAYRAGMTVVAAAGNFGKADDGRLIYGSVSTPGISPKGARSAERISGSAKAGRLCVCGSSHSR